MVDIKSKIEIESQYKHNIWSVVKMMMMMWYMMLSHNLRIQLWAKSFGIETGEGEEEVDNLYTINI